MTDLPPHRTSYHHGDLRAQLISAVSDLVETHGPDGFSVAEAARRAGVSSAAPYKHFKDRPEILRAVASEGMDRLREAMAAAAARYPALAIGHSRTPATPASGRSGSKLLGFRPPPD